MSFKFNFDVEEDEDESLIIPQPVASGSTSKPVPSASTAQTKPCYHVDLEEMMDTLPPSISYSSIQVPGIAYPLLRRDLYDARFQLVDEEGSKGASGDAETGKQNGRGDRDYVDSNTDLIPGLYEGGLKTWEGGVDLVEVLSNVRGQGAQLQEDEGESGSSSQGARVGSWAKGGRVLELGCGTSLPSAFILRSIFSRPVSSHSTIIHLQDYNKPVLSLVSLPNLLLAALPFLPIEALYSPEDNVDVEDMIPDLEGPGSLAITDSVKRAFRDLLDRHKIELKFTYGDWSGLAEELGASGTHANGNGESTSGYDLVLTSETIYSEDSVDALLDVLRAASRRSERKTTVVQDTEIEERLGDLAVREKWDSVSLADTKETVVLVGAKVLYFGVGGDLQSFIQRVEVDGWSEPVKEWTMGVGRKVVRVGW